MKASLQGILGRVERQMQQIEQAALAAEDWCSKLQQQQQEMEQQLKHHADMLHQGVNQAQGEAVASIQSVKQGMDAELQCRMQQMRNTHATLQVQRDLTMRVLIDGKDGDMASLESQLNAGGCSDVNLVKDLTTEIPTFYFKRDCTAVNLQQLRSFVGVLDPVQQSDVRVTQETVGADCSDTTQINDRLSAVTLSSVSIREKNSPREIVYSRNPPSEVLAICPISEGRLWVSYKLEDGSATLSKLFDVQGQILSVAETKEELNQLYPVGDDNVMAEKLAPVYNDWCLVRSDGCVEKINESVGTLACCSENGQVYQQTRYSKELWQVKFSPERQLVFSKKKLVFKAVPADIDSLRDVSPAGQYFAFTAGKKAKVYTRTTTDGGKLLCTYKADWTLSDLCFCRISGKEVLLVTVCYDNKVHVVDHTGGGHFLHHLDTGHLTLDRPRYLATDYHKHVWIGCHGGKVVVMDL